MSLKSDAIIGGFTRPIATWELNQGPWPYFGEIKRLSSFKRSHAKRHGGYWQPSFGSISILQTAFESAWPPPGTITLPLRFETDAGDIVIADTTGILAGLDETVAEYELYGPDDYKTTTTDGSATGGATLFDYFAWSCDPTRLNLSLDTSRATNVNLSFSLSGEKVLTDLLDQLAYECNHAFYIDSAAEILHLLDLTSNNGTRTITEFDFISAAYEAPVPYSLFKGGDYSVAGSYPQGKEYSLSYLFHTSQADIEAQLTRTKALLEKWWVTVKLPVGENDIAYGERINFIDTSKYRPLAVAMNARGFSFQLDAGKERLSIEGEATVSAA